MTVDLLRQLDDLKGLWMMGGSALEKSLPHWRQEVQEDAFPDLALVALAGQAMQFALQPRPGGSLQTVSGLPRLRLPSPPLAARQQISQLVRVAMLNEAAMTGVLRLLAARGYTVHPLDYMPRSFVSLPDLYAPWEVWQRADEVKDAVDESVIISRDNWDEWLPAERRTALLTLRSQNAQAARDLIAEKVPALAADERLRILELLIESVSAEDQALLESFADDRSAKVRRYVQLGLARIGVVQDDQAEVNEYAAFFTITKRLLKRSLKITANPLKTDAQKNRRAELAAKLSLQSFASVLQLDGEKALIEGWEHVDPRASDEFVRMVAATGSEQAAAMLASRLETLDGISAESFGQLFERLGRDSLKGLLPRVLEHDDASFAATLTCCQRMLGELSWAQLKPLRALKDLKALSQEDVSRNHVRQETLRQGLYSLGLLANRTAAKELLQLFTQTNMFASDPMLGILKLNVCLPSGESS